MKSELFKTVFSILGEEVSKINDKGIELNFNIKNFRSDGCDVVFTNVTKQTSKLIYNIARKIRIDNNLWFDSGFWADNIEWNLDWSLNKDKITSQEHNSGPFYHL